MTTFSDDRLISVWKNEFQTYINQDWANNWRNRYVERVEQVRQADRTIWMNPSFQEMLWNDNAVANIGPGNSVTVAGAYTDDGLASLLFDARNEQLPQIAVERGQRVEVLFARVLDWLQEKQYSRRRPKARLVRLLAAMFPDDMACLMDAPRIWRVQRMLGVARGPGDFVAQHALIRERLREVLGAPSTPAENVDQSIFTWYLWDAFGNKPDEGAVDPVQTKREAVDVPELSLLPPESQRRGLTYVQNNVGLLVAIVREAEHGVSREDLVSVIMQEAPHLQSASAAIIISQAQGGLGIIRLTDGGYRPTERGLDLLTAAEPAQVLRAPLIGRVFGMGHLLAWLAKHPEGAPSQELARYLQRLVPTWKTSQAGSYVVTWAKMVGLVRADNSAGTARIVLTDDGEDYAAALPSDFEERWRIKTEPADIATENEEAPPESVPTPEVIAIPEPIKSYGIDDVVEEGCFLAREKIESALTLLGRRKNLILQGPPGTGKTWLAKRLGYALMKARNPARLMAVQFQPSLSYEDFVRGWRPGADGRLDLIDGVFLEAIAKAQADQTTPFVVVIEEINRGNPAQIFGELLTLLEHDKRNPEEGLKLAYSRTVDERIHIPPNLYVVGTMNIADRSLALVDLALRRRFAFVTLAPSLGDEWRAWCEQQVGFESADVSEIAKRMQRLNETIRGDRSLGEQFCVGHSYVTPPAGAGIARDGARAWFRDAVVSEIEPLLREYWYDSPKKADEACAALLMDL
jgi:5-methylcytosine-specific restriction protein B